MGFGFGKGGGDCFGPASFAGCEDEEKDDDRLGEGIGGGDGEGEGEEFLSGGLTTKTSP